MAVEHTDRYHHHYRGRIDGQIIGILDSKI